MHYLTRMGWTGRAPAPEGTHGARLVTRRSTTMPRTATVHAVTAIGIEWARTRFTWSASIRAAPLCCERRSHADALHRGLRTCRPVSLASKRGWRRTTLLASLPCLATIEAGPQVPPAYSKPFRQGQKKDFRDAFAVAEAVQRPTTVQPRPTNN